MVAPREEEEGYPTHKANRNQLNQSLKFHRMKKLWGRVFLELIMENEDMLKEFYKPPAEEREESASDGEDYAQDSAKSDAEDSAKSDAEDSVKSDAEDSAKSDAEDADSDASDSDATSSTSR